MIQRLKREYVKLNLTSEYTKLIRFKLNLFFVLHHSHLAKGHNDSIFIRITDFSNIERS